MILTLTGLESLRNTYLEGDMFVIIMFVMFVWSVYGAWEFMTIRRKPKTFKEFVRLGPIFWVVDLINLYKTI